MTIGKRIKHIRNLRGLTQKELGIAIGFKDKTADVRIAQYESGTRVPKENVIADLARILQVTPASLTVPEINTYAGIMQTFFTLEDMYGLTVKQINGTTCLVLDEQRGMGILSLEGNISTWYREYQKLEKGEISQEEYDHWRYNYPELEAKRNTEALNAGLRKALENEV